MVSSAVYRYVRCKDELLTRLIVSSYDSLADHVEAALVEAGDAPVDRWVAAALAVRGWAVARPHEFALLYGTPVRGYHAPADTIDPASRTTLALVGIVTDAARAGRLTPPVVSEVEDPVLHRELRALAETIGTDLPDAVVIRVLAAWTQLFGLVAFELFGQTRNAVTAHDALLAETARVMAHTIGLDTAG
jgi:AcrR family transcriptional regulator